MQRNALGKAFLIAALTLTGILRAQGPAIPLSVVDVVPVPSIRSSYFGMLPVRSGNGGFYTRFVSLRGVEPDVRWVSADGKQTALFRAASIPAQNSAAHLAILDFAPMPHGGMAALVRWQQPGSLDQFAIAEFDRTGAYSTTVPLHLSFSPNRLAAFQSGRFFLSGGTPVAYGWSSAAQALVDAHGRLLRAVNLPLTTPTSEEWSGPYRAASANQRADDTFQKKTASSPEAKLANAAERSAALSGDDGAVYFTWPADAGRIYRITDAGDTTIVALAPAAANQKILSIQESHGNLVVNSGIPGRQLEHGFSISAYNLQVYDAKQGTLLASYSTGEPIGFGLVDFNPGNFYFLKKMPGPQGFSIVRAVPD